MAETRNDALQSPDYLGVIKRAAGVRRLNHVPVLIVTGGLCLVMAVVGYTIYVKRAAQLRAQGSTPGDHSEALPSAADAQLLRNSPDQGVIAAAAPPRLTDSGDHPRQIDVVRETPDRTHIPGVPDDSGSAFGASARHQAAEQRQQRLEQIELQRLDDAVQALKSDTAIDAKAHVEQQEAGNTSINPSGPLNAALTRATGEINDATALAGGPLGANSTSFPGRGSFNAVNGQRAKRSFLDQEPVSRDYLDHGLVAPISPYEVKAGTVIPATMIGGVNSDLPGLLLAQVSENIYDSATGRYLLIPQGAKLIGTYDNGVTFGQSRILVGWQRIIYPDSSSIDLGRMPGADQSGYAGFKDKINNHLFRLFSEALLLSIFSAGVQLGQPQASSGNNYNSSQIVAAALAGQMGELGMEIVRRNMDVAPTLEVRPGYSFNVMVTKDMVFPGDRAQPASVSTGNAIP